LRADLFSRGQLPPELVDKRASSLRAARLAAGSPSKPPRFPVKRSSLPSACRHQRADHTLNTYGHLFPDAFNDVGEALDRLVRSSSEAGAARR
jgi:hypothetical protein